MTRPVRLRQVVERLQTASTTSTTRRPTVCCFCASSISRLNAPTSNYSTSQRRLERPPENWEGLEWVGTNTWMKQLMIPKRPFDTFLGTKGRITDPQKIQHRVLDALVEVGLMTLPERNKYYNSPLKSPDDLKSIELSDQEVKFRLIKLLMQRLQYRIPDPVITSSTNAAILLKQLSKQPAPKNVKIAVAKDETFEKLHNVQFMKHKLQLRDKETQVGRWKVITAELEERGL